VQLLTMLTEVGTLELACVSLADPTQRWRLEFDLRRGDGAADPAGEPLPRPKTGVWPPAWRRPSTGSTASSAPTSRKWTLAT
jgi:hypothetical protein